MPANIFTFHNEGVDSPFAAGRNGDEARGFYTIVVKVVPEGQYGKAFGFSVANDYPNDHYASLYPKWRKTGEISSAGSFQWSLLSIPEPELIRLIQLFRTSSGNKYSWTSLILPMP